MQFHELKRKTANKKSRQHGRGGTRGKTTGRGTKGQNARAGRKKRPELRDLIKKVPKLRGRGVSSLKSRKVKATGAELKTLLADKKTKKGTKTESPSTKVKKEVN